MSEPSAGPGDVEPPPAQEKNLDQQVQPEGQAVGQQPAGAGDESAGTGPAAALDGTAGASAPADTEGTTEVGGTAPPPTPPSTPTTTPSPPSASPAATTVTDPLADAIEELRSQITDARDKKVSAESAFADVENRLTTLETVRKDADATVTAYTSAYDGLVAEDAAYTEYLEREEDSLETSLGDERTRRVKELAKESRRTGERLEREVTTATERLSAAEGSRDRRKAEVKAAGDLLTAWKKLAATLAGQHTELKKLRDEVTKARQAGQYGLALHGLRRAKRKRKQLAKAGPTLIPPAEVRGALVRAVDELADAERALADAERTVAARKERLTLATKERDQHRSTAEAALREQLVQLTKGDAVTTGGTDHA